MTSAETTGFFWAMIGFGFFLVWHEVTLRRENANMPLSFTLFAIVMLFVVLMGTGTR